MQPVGPAVIGILSDKFDIFFQSQSVFPHDLRMGNAYIAEMPRFMADARDCLPSGGVAQDKSIVCRLFPEGLADSRIGEFRTDKVDMLLLQTSPVWCSL